MNSSSGRSRMLTKGQKRKGSAADRKKAKKSKKNDDKKGKS